MPKATVAVAALCYRVLSQFGSRRLAYPPAEMGHRKLTMAQTNMASKATKELVSFWRKCHLAKPPFVHPDDLPVFRRYGGRHIDAEPKDFDAFVASPKFGDFADRRLDLSLLPTPYSGDLARADIVVLLLNPGFSYTDYYETERPDFRRQLVRTLRQSFAGTEFPFIWLDPQFCWHDGFKWWEGKLRQTVRVIADKHFDGRYLDALRDVAHRVAQIELVPYHSSAFGGHALIEKLESVRVARRYVHDVLVPAARKGAKTIIVTPQAEAWGVKRGRGVVIYKGGQTRGASLGPDTPGGKAILRRYERGS